MGQCLVCCCVIMLNGTSIPIINKKENMLKNIDYWQRASHLEIRKYIQESDERHFEQGKDGRHLAAGRTGSDIYRSDKCGMNPSTLWALVSSFVKGR